MQKASRLTLVPTAEQAPTKKPGDDQGEPGAAVAEADESSMLAAERAAAGFAMECANCKAPIKPEWPRCPGCKTPIPKAEPAAAGNEAELDAAGREEEGQDQAEIGGEEQAGIGGDEEAK